MDDANRYNAAVTDVGAGGYPTEHHNNNPTAANSDSATSVIMNNLGGVGSQNSALYETMSPAFDRIMDSSRPPPFNFNLDSIHQQQQQQQQHNQLQQFSNIVATIKSEYGERLNIEEHRVDSGDSSHIMYTTTLATSQAATRTEATRTESNSSEVIDVLGTGSVSDEKLGEEICPETSTSPAPPVFPTTSSSSSVVPPPRLLDVKVQCQEIPSDLIPAHAQKSLAAQRTDAEGASK